LDTNSRSGGKKKTSRENYGFGRKMVMRQPTQIAVGLPTIRFILLSIEFKSRLEHIKVKKREKAT
jgi:hypothetical protein